MKENENNLEIVDVEFTTATEEIMQGEDSNKASREEDLLETSELLVQEKIKIKSIHENQYELKNDLEQYKSYRENEQQSYEPNGNKQQDSQKNYQGNKEQNQDQSYQTDSYKSYQSSGEGTEETSRNTSFKNYAREENYKARTKKRSFIGRISRFCLIVIGIMLSIPCLIVGVGIVMGGCIASLGVIGTGMVAVVFTAFLMTVQPGLIGWLCAFVALGLLSGGGLALCMVILTMRGIRYVIRLLRGNDINSDLGVREE